MGNKKDFIFVCSKCQSRLAKKGTDTEFKWNDDSFKEMKINFKKLTGNKPDPKVVLTSCLGPCPDNAVTYVESNNGELKKEKSYPADSSKKDVFKLLFKTKT